MWEQDKQRHYLNSPTNSFLLSAERGSWGKLWSIFSKKGHTMDHTSVLRKAELCPGFSAVNLTRVFLGSPKIATYEIWLHICPTRWAVSQCLAFQPILLGVGLLGHACIKSLAFLALFYKLLLSWVPGESKKLQHHVHHMPPPWPTEETARWRLSSPSVPMSTGTQVLSPLSAVCARVGRTKVPHVIPLLHAQTGPLWSGLVRQIKIIFLWTCIQILNCYLVWAHLYPFLFACHEYSYKYFPTDTLLGNVGTLWKYTYLQIVIHSSV